MIRIVVLALVAANLLYLGWAHWASEEEPRLVSPAAIPGSSAPQPAASTPAADCISLGPLRDEVRAMEVEQLLRDMQLTPATRTDTQEIREGWWVYVASIDAGAQERALRTIQEAGITDAFSMSDDPGFRVSVGLFQEEAGAAARAEAVRALGLDAAVNERIQQQDSLWFDLPGATRTTLDMSRLAGEGVDVQTLRVEECPAGAAPQL